MAGCGADARTPTGLGPGGSLPGGQGDRPDAAALLLGKWENTMLVAADGDLQRWTTIWEFRDDASCEHTTVTESLVEGLPLTRVRLCRYGLNGATMLVTYSGATGSVAFDFAFAGFSPDRLVLDGFEFDRIP